MYICKEQFNATVQMNNSSLTYFFHDYYNYSCKSVLFRFVAREHTGTPPQKVFLLFCYTASDMEMYRLQKYFNLLSWLILYCLYHGPLSKGGCMDKGRVCFC